MDSEDSKTGAARESTFPSRHGSETGTELARTNSKLPASDLNAQTTQFTTKGTIDNAAFSADDALFFKLVEEQGVSILQKEGPVGDCPFLLLFLFNTPAHLAIAQKCMEKWPELIFSMYTSKTNPGVPALYTGETALHLAVVNKHQHMVVTMLNAQQKLHKEGKFLDKNLLTLPATGLFFDLPLSSGPCYYGHLPLGFAACTANLAMVKLLVSYGADMYFEDAHGNNLLHLLALHNLPSTYKAICNLEKDAVEKQTAKGDDKHAPHIYLCDRANKEGLRPLAVAACCGHDEVFNVILQSRMTTMWTYGPIEMRKNPLSGIDTIPMHVMGDMEGTPHKEGTNVIEVLVKNYKLDLLMHKLVIDLLSAKWEHYAFGLYVRRCLQHTLLVFCLTLSIVLGYPSHHIYLFSTANDKASTVIRLCAESILLIMMVKKFVTEMMEMTSSGWRDYFNKSGAVLLENVLSLGYCAAGTIGVILRVFAVYLYYSGGTLPYNLVNIEAIFMTTAVIAAYLYVTVLLLCFELTGRFIVMMAKMLKNDVARFLVILLVLLFGFATTFISLNSSMTQVVSTDGVEAQALESPGPFFWERLVVLLMVILGDIDFAAMSGELTEDWGLFFPVVSYCIGMLYVVMITIMLLNLLIAMMGDTYGEVKESTNKEFIYYKAQSILSLEAEMSAADWKKVKPYWIVENNKAFLQNQFKNSQYLSGEEETEELMLENYDIDGDKKLSLEELAQWKADTEKEMMNKILAGVGTSEFNMHGQVDPTTLDSKMKRPSIYNPRG